MTKGYRVASRVLLLFCGLSAVLAAAERNFLGFLLWGSAALAFAHALSKDGQLRTGSNSPDD
jgi:hypothetical protein